MGESRSTFQEIYDFFIIFLKYLRFSRVCKSAREIVSSGFVRARGVLSWFASFSFWSGG